MSVRNERVHPGPGGGPTTPTGAGARTSRSGTPTTPEEPSGTQPVNLEMSPFAQTPRHGRRQHATVRTSTATLPSTPHTLPRQASSPHQRWPYVGGLTLEVKSLACIKGVSKFCKVLCTWWSQ